MIFIMIEARGVFPATWKGVSLRMVVDLVSAEWPMKALKSALISFSLRGFVGRLVGG
jgi:hypothetical protein